MRIWWPIFRSVLYPRDYFLDAPNENLDGIARGVPFEYCIAVKIYEVLFRRAGLSADEILNGLHHLRGGLVTLISHLPRDRGGGVQASELKLVGNWRSDAMPQVYTAYSREIPLALSRRLVNEIRVGWRPEYEGASSAKSGGPVRALGAAQALPSVAMDDCVDSEVENRIKNLEQRAAALEPLPTGLESEANRVEAAEIERARGRCDPDELTSSEPSDGEIEAECAVVLFRKSSDYRNRLHIQNELVPSVTACPKHFMIEDMTSVPVPEVELAAMTSTGSKGVGLCVACVTARPDRFPESVVQALLQ
jgi:hypothetical protein